MKFRIIILLAFLSILFSCSKVNPSPENQGGEIKFADPLVTETKTTIITSSEQMIEGYSVFASKHVTDASGTKQGTMFMNNTKVYKDDGVWKYDANDAYHWSPGASHKFCGIFPYCDGNSGVLKYSVDVASGALEVLPREGDYIKTGVEEGGCPDILYDIVSYDDPFDVYSTPEPVAFHMKHACSIVTFNVTNRSDDNIQSVSGFLRGADSGGTSTKPGLFDQASSVSIGQNVVWNDLSVGEGSFEFSTDAISTGATAEKAGQKLVIPQNINTTTNEKDKLYLHLTVVFGNLGNSQKQYHVCLADIPLTGQDASLLKTWLPGKNYIYNLNVTSDFITCAVSVIPWIEDEFIDLK